MQSKIHKRRGRHLPAALINSKKAREVLKKKARSAVAEAARDPLKWVQLKSARVSIFERKKKQSLAN